ncbi:MAG TPA: hypothetical protein VM364_11380 [Vicinamibacterales bacterium]|nr:hypothetical protein [Vicinamibacterales bacterium]
MRALAVVILSLVLLAACSAPPQKELDRAQGAIEAARAAGAEQYASEIFKEASDSLREAHEAVAQRDYRLALTRALDAYDRGREAARGAAEGQARARGEAETVLAAAEGAIAQLDTRLGTPEATKLPARDLRTARRAVAAARDTVQKARAAIGAGDYAAARELVKEIPAEMREEIGRLEAAAAKKPQRPARRRR